MDLKHTSEARWQASELKFLVAPECASRLKEWARRHLSADPFASPDLGDAYLTTSLYFDTPVFDVFHENGSYGRAKYRVRRYGEAGHAFLERKLRTPDLVVKRRSVVPLDELSRLHEDPSAIPDWNGRWFHRRILARGMAPVCRISYRRTARVAGPLASPIRLTIDEDLNAAPAGSAAFDVVPAAAPLLEDQVIVEMKFRGAMPELFCQALREFPLDPETVSKYKLAARRLGLADRAAEPLVRAVA